MLADGKAERSLNLSLLLLLGLLWGMPYALTKVALATIPPITMVAARVALAAVALWIVIWIVGHRRPKRLCFPRLFVQGCVGCLIPHTLIAFGQQTVDSALAAILNSMAPLFVCLIGLACIRYERLTPRQWSGATVGLMGVAMVAGVSALAGVGQTMIGQMAIILATLSSAVSVICGRGLNDIAPEVAAAGTLTSAAVVLIPLCLWIEAPLQATPSLASLAALLTNAIVTTALGFVVYFRLIRTVGSMGTASVGYLKPAVGVLIGCTLVGESFTWTIAMGLIAILIGVAAINQTDTGWSFPRLPAAIRLRCAGRTRVSAVELDLPENAR